MWSYRAIVTDISGTTRELLHEHITIAGKPTVLIDSPWLEDINKEMQFIEQIIEESDVLLFVVDAKDEITEQEYRIRDLILKHQKKEQTILIGNKLDSKVYGPEAELLIADLYILWISRVVPMSAEQYEGLDLLTDELHDLAKDQHIPRNKGPKVKHTWTPIAIIGRPNVGKSTLLNKLVGEELSRVEDKPGTTLDYITATFTREGKEFQLFDTAGIRKKSKIVWLEKIAYAKTVDMLYYTKPVVAMIIDIQEWMTHRDKSLLGEIIRMWLPIVIGLNKIDLVEPEEADYMIKKIRTQAWFDRIPIIKISGQAWISLPKLLKKIYDVYARANDHVKTAELNKTLQKAWLTSPPRFPKNKICKWKYISQVDQYPPIFSLSVNNKEYANFAFKRRVEKVIRKSYGFEGVPIKLSFINKVDKNPYLTDNSNSRL